MDIAFIAPYESMRFAAQSLIESKGYPAKVYVGNMEAGVNEARKALRNGAKIFISRGGTASMIRDKLGIDVIEVGASIYKILGFLHDSTTPETRVAIAGYRPFLSVAQPVCAILKRDHALFELGARFSPQRVMDAIEAWRPHVILGDVVAWRLAEGRSHKFHLIESTLDTMTDALNHGMLVLNNLQRHIDNAEKLSAVLNCTQEGAILVNSDGGIEEINLRGCEFLRTKRENVIGTLFCDIFTSQELSVAVRSKRSVKNMLVNVGGHPFVVDLAMVMPEAGVNAAVILFQKVQQLQETESKVRKKLLEKGFYAKYTFIDIKYRSQCMSEVLEVAKAYSSTTCNIMIQGETGTGKELFAQSIHNASPLAGGPFVPINCAALPKNLLESELFGYAPGAFTGALRSGKAGLFEMAHNGTLFLDEITEMDIFLQSRLLRTLQAKEIMRVGDSRVIPVSVRIIAASNKNLAQAMAAGELRTDLFFRLNVLDLCIPPLREREDDPSFLFLYFLELYEKRLRKTIPRPDKEFLRRLDMAPWPGNVRELENMVEKYCILQSLPIDSRGYLPMPSIFDFPGAAARSGQVSAVANGSLDQAMAMHIRAVLAEEGGNISRAAVRLGVTRNTLKRRLGGGAEAGSV